MKLKPKVIQSIKTHIILLFATLLAPVFCFSQEPMYWQLTDEDGLPSMTIYDILQDDEGYIWFGTANGICRYDGSQVKVFDHPQLKDREIIDIEKDAWNRIWMVNLSGQLAYIQEGEVKFLEGPALLEGKQLKKLHIEGNTLRVLSVEAFKIDHRQLLTYQLSKDEEPKLLPRTTNPNFSIYMMESNPNKEVVVYLRSKQHTCFYRYDSLSNLTKEQFTIPLQYKRFGPQIADFGFYKDQKIVAMAKGIKEKKTSIFSFRDTIMNQLYVFDDPILLNGLKVIGSDLWLMSTNGIWTANLDSLAHGSLPFKKILAGIKTNNIIRDREGSYWVLTAGQGALIIPSLSLKQVKVSHKNVPIKEVYSLLADPAHDRVISGHLEGIVSVHEKQELPKIIDLHREGEVRDIFQRNDNAFYCVSNHGSVIFDSLLQIQNRLTHNASKKLLIDQNDRFWIGTSSGVFSTPQIKNHTNKKSEMELGIRTYALHEDSNLRIWLGTINGLYYYEDSLVKPFDTQDSIKHFITDFAEPADGTLWVSTQTNGVFAIKDNQVIQRYTSENGLASNDCKRLFWDGQLLWICTNQGLYYLEPNTGKIAYLNKKDGLPSNEVNDVAVLNNQVWVGTSKGLVYFPKNMVHHNTAAPLVYLSNFKVWDKAYAISAQNELSSKQNNLAFEFIGIALKAKNAVTYKYKIVGIDHDWVYTATPIARYPVVNPGTYRFEVYAINEDNVESTNPAVLEFTVAGPWWKKWWVIGLILLGLASTIIYFVRRKLRKENQKRIAQNKIDQLRQKALQTQMNPHFIFNALSAIQKSMTTNESEKALLYLSRFAKLIRSIFDYSDREVINLEEEIDFLKLYLNLENLRFKNKVMVDFSVDADLDQHLYSTLLPPLLLQPLVENAFKHGFFHKDGEGYLQLRFSKQQNYLCFSIEDNGVGRASAKKLKEETDIYQTHQSSGISNIKERLSIINSKSGTLDFPTLQIEDIQQGDQATGTRIEVYIYCKNFESGNETN